MRIVEIQLSPTGLSYPEIHKLLGFIHYGGKSSKNKYTNKPSVTRKDVFLINDSDRYYNIVPTIYSNKEKYSLYELSKKDATTVKFHSVHNNFNDTKSAINYALAVNTKLGSFIL